MSASLHSKDKVKINCLLPFSRLEEFRSSGFLTDVTFQVGDVAYRCHKLVLSCHSPVFEAMFRSNMSEAHSGVVVIEDVTPEVFAMFLHYLYTGDIDEKMTIEDATQLLVCADKYQTSSLMRDLDEAFSDKLTPLNAVEVHQIADSFNRATLKRDARCMMWSKFSKTAASESWRTVLPGNKKLMNELLLDFYSRARIGLEELQGSVRITRHDNRCFKRIWMLENWTGWYRPAGVRMSYRGRTLNFTVVFSRIGSFWVVSLYPNTFTDGVVVFCKASVCKDGDDDCNESKEYLFSWPLDAAHPTLGHRRVEILRWSGPELTCLDFQLQAYGTNDRLPDATAVTVTGWEIEQEPTLTERAPPADGSISLFFGESLKSVLVDRSAAMERCCSDVLEDVIKKPHVSEITGRTIARYINSGVLPHRDWINFHLLEAACELRVWDLILYVEQALVWELDPSNVLDAARRSHDLHLGWLTGATAQYLKFHLDRVMRCDEEWRNLPFEYFQILMTEMHTNLYPCLLPNFLTAQRNKNNS